MKFHPDRQQDGRKSIRQKPEVAHIRRRIPKDPDGNGQQIVDIINMENIYVILLNNSFQSHRINEQVRQISDNGPDILAQLFHRQLNYIGKAFVYDPEFTVRGLGNYERKIKVLVKVVRTSGY